MTNATPTILVPSGSDADLGEATDIREVKPPVPILSAWSWLGPLLALVLLALVLWGMARFWRKRRARSAPSPPVVAPPHVRARERLHAALELLGRPEPFCVSISDTLRIYLEDRFELRAPERTTEEFLDELAMSPRLSFRQKETLTDFLTRCDLVKFARDEPGEPELRDLLEVALRLVDETAEERGLTGGAAGPVGRSAVATAVEE